MLWNYDRLVPYADTSSLNANFYVLPNNIIINITNNV